MYGCESWTINKAECWRIDAFELWCWRRLLKVPWTARKSNQSILKEISPEYSLEELMLKLTLQYLATWCEELTHLKRPWCWERLKAGGEGDDQGWDDWMASPTQWTWVSSGSSWWTGKPGLLQSTGCQSDMTEWLNWTDGKIPYLPPPPTILETGIQNNLFSTEAGQDILAQTVGRKVNWGKIKDQISWYLHIYQTFILWICLHDKKILHFLLISSLAHISSLLPSRLFVIVCYGICCISF